MSLILVATVCGVLLERCVVARRSGVWGYAGAERWTRSAPVRGPLQPCSTSHCARRPEEARTAGSDLRCRLGTARADEATPTVVRALVAVEDVDDLPREGRG